MITTREPITFVSQLACAWTTRSYRSSCSIARKSGGLDPTEALAVLGFTAQALCYCCSPRRSDQIAEEFIAVFTEAMQQRKTH